MASYTTLVDVDADTASKLAQYVSTLIGGTEGTDFNTACKKLIEDSKTEDLVAKFLQQNKAIFAIENDGDVVGFFEALVSVTFTLREDIDATPVIKQILKTLSEDTANKPKLRLKAMVSLFNLASGKSKYDIIIGDLRFWHVLVWIWIPKQRTIAFEFTHQPQN
jgi:hypothetical protein